MFRRRGRSKSKDRSKRSKSKSKSKSKTKSDAFDPFGDEPDGVGGAKSPLLTPPTKRPTTPQCASPISTWNERLEWGGLEDSFQSAATIQETPFSATCSVDSAANSGLQLDEISDISKVDSEDDAACPVFIQEQISIIFDGAAGDPSCQVIGSIHLKSQQPDDYMNILLRDKKGYIEKSVEQDGVCTDITGSVSPSKRRKGDKVLRVSSRETDRVEAPIFSYRCSSRLKPIPLLIKIKSKCEDKLCRVSISIRANPKNKANLINLAVLLAVSPGLEGQGVQLSKEGAIWDELKRTLSFANVGNLQPGEIFNVHGSFKQVGTNPDPPKLPVLVRTETASLYSGIECFRAASGREGNSWSATETDARQLSKIIFRKI